MDPYGYSAARLAELCGVEISTARRWKRAGRVPTRYHHLMQFFLGKDLGAFAKEWEGWRLRDGNLWSPEDQSFTPGLVRSAPLYAQMASEARHATEKAIEAASNDHERLHRLKCLETLQAGLHSACEALDGLISQLNRKEQNRLVRAHPDRLRIGEDEARRLDQPGIISSRLSMRSRRSLSLSTA